MKLSSQKYSNVKRELVIPMTSMIDVVFLLLIFFLVTTTFIRPEQQISSNIKVLESNAGLESFELDPAIIDIYWANGQVFFKMGAVQTNRISELQQVMASFGDKSGGAFVRVGERVPFEFPASAIAAFKANGFDNVSYLPVDQ